MTNRERLIDYVKHGGHQFLCSPQIGAGAGFDTKMVGKSWISQTTCQDTIAAYNAFDVVPLLNFGLPDLTNLTNGCRVEGGLLETSSVGSRKNYAYRLVTPVGTLTTTDVEEEKKGVAKTKYYITEEEELPILEYYLDRLLEATDFSPITRQVRAYRELAGENALDVQWAMQPYELLCFPNTLDTAMLAMDCPKTFYRLMDKILQLDERLIQAVANGGSDFVFLGGPGAEMISPRYYQDFLVPYSQQVTQMVHKAGMLVYTHICSPIEPMLTMGFYNQMGIDLFETLSQPPVGNVQSLEDAFAKIDPAICTRGNVGLDLLLTASPEEIYDHCLAILTTAKQRDRKHILAASDYMFYDIAPENVHAMARAVTDFNGK